MRFWMAHIRAKRGRVSATDETLMKFGRCARPDRGARGGKPDMDGGSNREEDDWGENQVDDRDRVWRHWGTHGFKGRKLRPAKTRVSYLWVS